MKSKTWWELDSPEGMKWLRHEQQKVRVLHHSKYILLRLQENNIVKLPHRQYSYHPDHPKRADI